VILYGFLNVLSVTEWACAELMCRCSFPWFTCITVVPGLVVSVSIHSYFLKASELPDSLAPSRCSVPRLLLVFHGRVNLEQPPLFCGHGALPEVRGRSQRDRQDLRVEASSNEIFPVPLVARMQSGSLGRRGLDFAEPVLSEVEGLHPGYSLLTSPLSP